MIFGRKSALWTPESPQKPYIDHPTQYGYILKKVKKNRIFHLQNQHKNFFPDEYFGRCGPANKSISGVNRSYSRPQIPIILGYAPHPFLAECIIKNPRNFQKTNFFHKSVVFVAFWVLLMLFFKISKMWRCCYLFLFFSYDV